MPPLGKLPLVDHIVGVQSFVPTNQATKLAAIQDAAGILGPVLGASAGRAAPDADALRQSIAKCLTQLQPALIKLPPGHPLARIADDLKALTSASNSTLVGSNAALVRFLPAMLDRLKPH